MSKKQYFSPNEVATMLMVSPVTLRQWAQKGMIDAHTTAGGHRRFTADAIRRFAAARNIDVSDRLPEDMNVSAAGPSVLVVDDDVQLNRYLVTLFRTHCPNVAVYSANDGFAAGRMVQAKRPSVVLLDVMMPGMDGVSVARNIKSDPDALGIRVVGMTGYYSDSLRDQMLEAGASVLLRKPFANEELFAACEFEELVLTD